MIDLCAYKNLIGEPKTGIHFTRFMGVAIYDVIITVLGAFLISYFFKYSFIHVTVFLFVLGIISHRIFCVKSAVDKWLFP